MSERLDAPAAPAASRPAVQTKSRGVDLPQLKALLRAYLKMSMRESILMRSRGGPSSFTFVIGMYLVVGALISAMLFARPDVFLFAVAVHAMTFFAVGMAAVIEANEVLFDRREEDVFAPLPIHPRTLLLAKSITLIAFVSLLALAMNLVPTFAGLAATDARPWFPLVHLASVLLITTFACGAVVCIYGIVLRLFGRERFENLAVWAQVGMVVMYVGGFQILPRIMADRSPEEMANFGKYLLPTPPGWFAALDAWLAGGASGPQFVGFAALAAGATVLLAWFGVQRLSAGYSEPTPRSAPPRASEERAAKDGTAVRSKPAAWRSRNPLLRRWVSDPIEWAAFRLAIAYIRRDREVKLRVYTSVSMFALLVVLALVDGRSQRASFLPLVMLALASTTALTALEGLESSSQFAAAEIFASTPIESAAPLFHGVRKACILFLQLPLVALSLVMLFLLRSSGRHDLLPVAPVIAVWIPTLTLIPGALATYVPLSKPPKRGQQSSRRVLLMMGTMFGMMALAGLGIGAQKLGLLWPLVGVEIAVAATIHVSLLRKIRTRPLLRAG